MQGWLEAKRTADEMRETRALDPRAVRKGQAMESPYSLAGHSHRDGGAPPQPTVAFAGSGDDEIRDASSDPNTEGTQATLAAEDKEESGLAQKIKKNY